MHAVGRRSRRVVLVPRLAERSGHAEQLLAGGVVLVGRRTAGVVNEPFKAAFAVVLEREVLAAVVGDRRDEIARVVEFDTVAVGVLDPPQPL